MQVTVRKIISGGQTGADRGGLDAAIALGIEHGGWCPASRRAEDGRIPGKYRLVEARSRGYRARTERNVEDSDATVIVVRDSLTPGSRLAFQLCADWRRPVCVCKVGDFAAVASAAAELSRWLIFHQPEVLNVAGSRESKAPGLQLDTAALLLLALAEK